MDNHSQEHENDANNTWGFFAGLLIGGLAGAVAMLLLAPQSGKRTRAKIQQKSIELREQTAEAVEDVVAQARRQSPPGHGLCAREG
jgi:gas vesicle protein